MPRKETVVVLGANPKPERPSNQAIRMLREHGHQVIPVHPLLRLIEGLPVAQDLSCIREKVNTLTLYVNPEEMQASLGINNWTCKHEGRE